MKRTQAHTRPKRAGGRGSSVARSRRGHFPRTAAASSSTGPTAAGRLHLCLLSTANRAAERPPLQLQLCLSLYHPSPESPSSPPRFHPAPFPSSCLSHPSLLLSSLVTHSSTSRPFIPEELPYIGYILFDSFLLFNRLPASLLLVVLVGL